MKKIFTLLFLVLSGIPVMTRAQFQGQVYKEDTSISVSAYNQVQTLAWCGGFNNPQFATADLDHDGLNDLVVFEKSTGILRTFINRGTPGNPDYRYAPKYAHNFPGVNNFLIMQDYNCDQIPDLIHGGQYGVVVYRGYYNASNELSFVLYKDLYYQSPVSGNTNVYVAISDIPGVADIDGDGDLDFLSYSIQGAAISLYKNCQVEEGLPCDSLRICFADACWGKSYQGYERAQTLHFSCNQFGTSSCRSTDTSHKTTLHSGNALCMIDIDNDGDYDYLDGNLSYPDVQLMINGKTQYGNGKDSMMAQDTLWQTGGIQAHMPNWPSTFWIDVDQDGKKDILISPHAEGSSENYKCAAYYRNTGTVSAPNYTFQTDTFLIDKTIDLGAAAVPVFYDYNKDGKPDLFIGSDGYYQNGLLVSKIAYYENTSTPGNPSFTLQTRDFMGISARNFHGATLAFGDLDGDGKDDMVIGHNDGTVTYFRNTAASATAQPVWQFVYQMLKDAAYNYIDVGSFAAPVIYDINKDGKPDLIIGYQGGYLFYYENTNTTVGTVNVTKVTNKLGNVQTDLFSGYSTPFIGRMDNNTKDYLLMGSYSGALYRYDDFQTGNVSGNFTRIDSLYSGIIGLGSRTAPAVADVDGDGMYEMVIGNVLGGVYLFKQTVAVSVGNVNGGGNSDNCAVYPNPAKDILTATWNVHFSGNKPVAISLYNMMGQRLALQTVSGQAKEAQISLQNIPPGIYSCIMQSGDKRFVTNVTILK